MTLFRELVGCHAMPAGVRASTTSRSSGTTRCARRSPRRSAKARAKREPAAHRLEPELCRPPRASPGASGRRRSRGRGGDPARGGDRDAGARRRRIGGARQASTPGAARRTPARRSARIAIAAGLGCGDRFQEVVAHQALALLALGERPPRRCGRRARAARASSGRRARSSSRASSPFVPDLIEAYARRRRAPRTRASGSAASRRSPRTRGQHVGACRVRALRRAARGGRRFDEPFGRALELLERLARYVLELARTRLAYGERLRRQGRRRDARMQLRAAYDAFAAAGATPWHERAAAELRATGEQVAEAAAATARPDASGAAHRASSSPTGRRTRRSRPRSSSARRRSSTTSRTRTASSTSTRAPSSRDWCLPWPPERRLPASLRGETPSPRA